MRGDFKVAATTFPFNIRNDTGLAEKINYTLYDSQDDASEAFCEHDFWAWTKCSAAQFTTAD